jgi:hypothetical protein
MMHNFTPVFTPESHILSSSSLYTRFHGRFELVVLLCWSSSTLLVYLIVLYRVMDWFLAHRFNQMSFINEQILLEFHHFVNSIKRLSRFWMKAHLGQNSRGNFLLLCYLHHQFISLYRRGVHSMQLQVSIQQDTGVGTRWRQCGPILMFWCLLYHLHEAHQNHYVVERIFPRKNKIFTWSHVKTSIYVLKKRLINVQLVW